MDGLAFVQMVEVELKKRGIPKEQFYRESGISSATMSQWRKRIYSPSSAAIKKIEEYLGVVFTIEQKEKAPTTNGERSVSDAELKFALWGDCTDVDDDDLADVRRYAAFVRERKKDKK